MRFADKRYYVEAYVKCANCGVLLYDEAVRPTPDGPPFCSDWCAQWHAERAAGRAPQLKLPRDADGD
ncbi:MAG: hypothetical protein R3F55_16895 [Alphaproteobacteria bacterium]